VTPDLAQQACALPYGQRQHNRKESRSEHVMLAIPKGKSCASQKGWGSPKILTFSAASRRRTKGSAEFSGRCRKFRSALDTADLAGSIALYDGNSNAVTTLSHTAHLHGPASRSAGALPEVIRSGVMNGAELRYQDMNEPKRANTPLVHTRLSIVGMSCGACVRHLTAALNEVTGVVHVDVDLSKNEAVVNHLLDRVDETVSRRHQG
jgi:copper chaperone CopZ